MGGRTGGRRGATCGTLAPSPIAFSNGNLDGFHRVRVSNPIQLLNSKFDHDDTGEELWNRDIVGAATITHIPLESCQRLAVSGIGDRAVMQTKEYFSYKAGNSLLGLMTFVLKTPVLGARKRLGYFDDNNGFFFEQNEDGEHYMVLRSNVSGLVVEERIGRTAWEHYNGSRWVMDPFDGTGAAPEATPDNGQIFVWDMQWLGMGAIRTAFDMDGLLIPAHTFRNANNKPTVYMQTGTLPLRYEIEAIGDVAAEFDMVCSTVLREGSEQEPAVTGTVDRDVRTLPVSSGAGRVALIGLRLKAAWKFSQLRDFIASFLATDATNDEYFIELILNPTIDPADAAVWATTWADAPSPRSIAQRNVPLTSIGVSANTGRVVASGYVPSGRTSPTQVREVGESLPLVQLNFAGDSDVLVLCVQPISGVNLDCVGEISFKEVF